jgi:hypothetical protein
VEADIHTRCGRDEISEETAGVKTTRPERRTVPCCTACQDGFFFSRIEKTKAMSQPPSDRFLSAVLAARSRAFLANVGQRSRYSMISSALSCSMLIKELVHLRSPSFLHVRFIPCSSHSCTIGMRIYKGDPETVCTQCGWWQLTTSRRKIRPGFACTRIVLKAKICKLERIQVDVGAAYVSFL